MNSVKALLNNMKHYYINEQKNMLYLSKNIKY
jgi:hypothetical protein